MSRAAKWYNDRMIQFAICKHVYERTVDYIMPRPLAEETGTKRRGIRYRRIRKPDALIHDLDFFELRDKPYNFYCSAAIVTPEFPLISLDFKKEQEDREYINENWDRWVVSYDFVLDFDAEKNEEIEGDDTFNGEALQAAWKDCNAVKVFFDELKIPYWLMYSGNKGFNIRVDGKIMRDVMAKHEQLEAYQRLAGWLSNELELSTLDESVYTDKRVFKIPYSVARRNMLVALPLSDDQFNSFDERSMSVEAVKREVRLFNRGLLQRPGGVEGLKHLFSLSQDFSGQNETKQENGNTERGRGDEKPQKGFFSGLKKRFKDAAQGAKEGWKE